LLQTFRQATNFRGMTMPRGSWTGVQRLFDPPRELPPDPVVVVGRADELARVLATRRPGEGVRTPAAALICGPAGVGKSTLAVRAGHRLAAAFPDGQIYIDVSDADGPVTPGLLVGRALRALGPTGDVPEHTDERIGRYRSLTAARRVLVIADGVSRAAQVRTLIPAGAGSALIAASRRQLRTLDAVSHIHLSSMTAGDAKALLAAYVGEERLDDAAATADLIGLCDRLPLALRIAAARLAARPGLTVDAQRAARRPPAGRSRVRGPVGAGKPRHQLCLSPGAEPARRSSVPAARQAARRLSGCA
jgi:hypothetical protein